jgi:hypothetical protein
MQKFPLRMKDNDLLVTELYKDPANDQITSISVYLTPKTTSEYFPPLVSPSPFASLIQKPKLTIRTAN